MVYKPKVPGSNHMMSRICFNGSLTHYCREYWLVFQEADIEGYSYKIEACIMYIVCQSTRHIHKYIYKMSYKKTTHGHLRQEYILIILRNRSAVMNLHYLKKCS